MFERVFKKQLHPFDKLSAPMEAFATVKQPRFFNGDSLESSDANIYIYLFIQKHHLASSSSMHVYILINKYISEELKGAQSIVATE